MREGAMSNPSRKRGRDQQPDDDRTRAAKERRVDAAVQKVEQQLNSNFAKLHSSKAVLEQATSTLEMIGGLISRQKLELNDALHRLRRACPTDHGEFRLTVVADAAVKKYDQYTHLQVLALERVESAVAAAHDAISKETVSKEKWPPLPPIRARAERKPTTPPRT